MKEEIWKSEMAAQTRTLQIVWGGLLAGCLTFMVIALALTFSGAMTPLNTAPLLTYLGAGLSVLFVMLRGMIPSLITRQARRALAAGNLEELPILGGNFQPRMAELIQRTGDVGRLAGVYGSQTIVTMAILEGTCFMNLLFFLLEQNYVSLGLALLMLAMLAVNFPLHVQMMAWIEEQLRWKEERRQFRR